MMRLILHILTYMVWIITAAGIPLLLGFARAVHYQRPIEQIEVKPLNKHEVDFVSANEIIRMIRRDAPSMLQVQSINNRNIEHLMNENPYINHVQAYTTLDRVQVIRFSERVPMMQILDLAGNWYYLDRTGVIFPMHPERVFRLLPATGYFKPPVKGTENTLAQATDSLRNKAYNIAFRLGRLIHEDKFLNLLIDHIYLDDKQQIELIPTIGSAGIFLGDYQNLQGKLENIAAFYKAKSTTADFGRFTRINASFENQIVCTIKRDSI